MTFRKHIAHVAISSPKFVLEVELIQAVLDPRDQWGGLWKPPFWEEVKATILSDRRFAGKSSRSLALVLLNTKYPADLLQLISDHHKKMAPYFFSWEKLVFSLFTPEQRLAYARVISDCSFQLKIKTLFFTSQQSGDTGFEAFIMRNKSALNDYFLRKLKESSEVKDVQPAILNRQQLIAVFDPEKKWAIWDDPHWSEASALVASRYTDYARGTEPLTSFLVRTRFDKLNTYFCEKHTSISDLYPHFDWLPVLTSLFSSGEISELYPVLKTGYHAIRSEFGPEYLSCIAAHGDGDVLSMAEWLTTTKANAVLISLNKQLVYISPPLPWLSAKIVPLDEDRATKAAELARLRRQVAALELSERIVVPQVASEVERMRQRYEGIISKMKEGHEKTLYQLRRTESQLNELVEAVSSWMSRTSFLESDPQLADILAKLANWDTEEA